ncbi:MAG: hypothetical protein ACI8Y6_000718, partial [Brevundimonas sp.]
ANVVASLQARAARMRPQWPHAVKGRLTDRG